MVGADSLGNWGNILIITTCGRLLGTYEIPVSLAHQVDGGTPIRWGEASLHWASHGWQCASVPLLVLYICVVIDKLKQLQWVCSNGDETCLASEDNRVLAGVMARMAAFSSVQRPNETTAFSSMQRPCEMPWWAAPQQLWAQQINHGEAMAQPLTRPRGESACETESTMGNSSTSQH